MHKEILKEKIKENYGKIALNGNLGSCCGPQRIYDINNISKKQMSSNVEYKDIELKSIHEESILGLGSGAPLKFADLKRGETVVDIGSGAGIDVFLASKLVGNKGKVIGIDITYEMLEKERKASIGCNNRNVEFRKGNIEEKIPIDDNSVDVVISNCVINLTSNKTNTFKRNLSYIENKWKSKNDYF
jgi:arsenite methyltransferase